MAASPARHLISLAHCLPSLFGAHVSFAPLSSPPLDARSNDVFDGLTGVDRSNKPESVVSLLGGDRRAARAVLAAATALLLGGAGLLFWLLQGAVRERRGGAV